MQKYPSEIQKLLKQADKLQEEINRKRPLKQKRIQLLKNYYLVGLTYTSNSLEGNSLTESETKVVIEEGLTIGGKPLRDHLEAQGHARAYEYMFSLVSKKGISIKDIKKLHKLFYEKIDTNNAGKYREVEILITGSKHSFPKPKDIDNLMKKFEKDVKEYLESEHPVVAATKIHKDFVNIHPFVDGNGRIARLIMNLILLQNKYNVTIIPTVLRAEYMQSLEKAHTDDTDFTILILKCLIESQREWLRLLDN
jgi:Fic family protein